jgi:hypothetical protein
MLFIFFNLHTYTFIFNRSEIDERYSKSLNEANACLCELVESQLLLLWTKHEFDFGLAFHVHQSIEFTSCTEF